MYFSPTTFVAKLLAAMQVLMTLDMPLSTTMALPVTSKPIESTVENLAWQAWIELPPEQKLQVKSRKVTPKSIFTLPLRVECPEGHKQVDSKCIPIAIGSNDVLIDLSALGLLVGSTQGEDLYDYDGMGEELSSPLAFDSEMPAGEAVKSSDGLTIDLKPPAKDEPLKFNIFQNKFHIIHEEPMEDYGALSNEGPQSSEMEQNITVTTLRTNNSTANATTNFNDLVSEASNISENVDEFFIQIENGALSSDSLNENRTTTSNLSDDRVLKIEAISVPALGNHSSIQLVTTIMDGETTTILNQKNKPEDNDFTILLQTESFLPLLNHTTATTLQNSNKFSLTTMPLRELSEKPSDILRLNVDEEITTLSSLMEQNIVEVKNKQEFTRSVTLNPLLPNNNDNDEVDDDGDDAQIKESTLEIVTTNNEPLETTTPIQLDDTTIIESYSSLSATSTAQQELKDLLLQQEQALTNFEELQRMRKGQKYQHVVLKKSKVQPVEVLSKTTEASTTTTKSATSAASLPTATKNVEELLTTTAETAIPLLTVHNENENNDRFYYQHLTKQDNEVTLRSASQLKQKSATENVAEKEAAEASFLPVEAATGKTITTPAKSTESKTISLTSEIDLAEELRLINELVKGIRKPTTLTTIKNMPTTITSTVKPTTTATTTKTPIILTDNIESSSSSNTLSESSSSVVKKSTLTTSQLWSKIMPLLTTSTTTPMPKSSGNESFSESQQKESRATSTFEGTTTSSSLRSNRNSKIIRINGFNKMSAAKFQIKDFTTKTTLMTTTLDEESSTYSSTTSSSSESSTTENITYDPYWWLPVSWRPDKTTSTEMQPDELDGNDQSKEQPLLLRFWSAYASKSS